MDLFGDGQAGGGTAGAPGAPSPAAAPYRVLARKYRPSDFAGLIGQEPLVRTLTNAIATNRLAQAWLLTGVRGVGKTSAARILARAINCTGPDGTGGPTASPCGLCETCVGIAAGAHMDVIEMDAASNTGVDDVREIIEAVRYRPASARFKVYIIDEVHMLSRSAWNALLKTLEEPPPHAKFVFATTEVEKIPPTILSRCQRFDLRRVPHERLVAHFAGIASAEGVEAEQEALELVARAADGSVRDGLSILDQAIALCAGRVTAEAVRAMLGLADRRAVIAVLEAVLEADARGALAAFAAAHAQGAEPAAIIEGVLDLLHATTRAAIGGPPDPRLGEAERSAVARWAARLDLPLLHRLWQLALKAHADIRMAPRPDHAAEMALLRMAHGAGLPDPEALLRLLDGAGAAPGGLPCDPADAPSAPADGLSAAGAAHGQQVPADFPALVALLADSGEAALARILTDRAVPEALAPGRLSLRVEGETRGLAGALADALGRLTGLSWSVRVEPAEGPLATLRARQARAAEARQQAVRAHPVVRALTEAFPDAELTAVEQGPPEAAAGREEQRRHSR